MGRVLREGIFALLAVLPAIAQTPVFTSETRVVEIPIVGRNSNETPVTDLRASELQLFDNRQRQKILSLEKTRMDGGSAGAGGTPAAGGANAIPRRITIILLDTLNTEFGDQLRGRQAVSQMLRDLPPASGAIAVFALGNGLNMLHPLSPDASALRAVVDEYPGDQPDLGISPREPMARFPAAPDNPRLQERRMEITLEAFRQIAGLMKSVRGEKNLLWITGGYSPPEDRHPLLDAARILASAQVIVYPIDARGLLPCPRLNCPEINEHIESMVEVAHLTGGRAFHDGNDLASFARAAMDDSREAYLLTYSPANYKPDGSPHEVLVKSSRKGVELRYRPGYVADRR